MKSYRISDIFANKPDQWAFRGDESYWDYLYSYYKSNSDMDYYLWDISVEKIYDYMSYIYKGLSNNDELFSDRERSLCNIQSWGMSGGVVNPQWWNSVGKAYINYVYTKLLFLDYIIKD